MKKISNSHNGSADVSEIMRFFGGGGDAKSCVSTGGARVCTCDSCFGCLGEGALLKWRWHDFGTMAIDMLCDHEVFFGVGGAPGVCV